jgi:beta-lactamase class A
LLVFCIRAYRRRIRVVSANTVDRDSALSSLQMPGEHRVLQPKISRRQFACGAAASLIGAAIVSKSSRVRAAAWSKTLGDTLARLEAESHGRLGVSILDTQTGARIGQRASERFPMCSTFKLLLVGGTLARIDGGHEQLTRRIKFTAADVVAYSPVTEKHVGAAGMSVTQLCAAALTRSDNTAANLLLAALGGPAALTSYARSIGDGTTRLDRIEPDLNEATPDDPRDTTTPDAMLTNIWALAVGNVLKEASCARMAAWLVDNKTGDARLRAGLPKAWRVGDKTGSGEHGSTNDVAIIWPPHRKPVIVSVYLTNTTATAEQCNATLAAIGRAVADDLTSRSGGLSGP